MDIYSALKKDHRKVEQLLDKLVEASKSGSDEWKEIVDEIRDELVPHSRVEEALFYNPIRETEHGKDVVMHSYQEHFMAESELRALQAMSIVDANWTAVAEKLRKDILHHVEEEEGKVFQAAKQVFSENEADTIGEAFEDLKPKVRAQSMIGTSIDLMLNLLPQDLRRNVLSTLSRWKKSAA